MRTVTVTHNLGLYLYQVTYSHGRTFLVLGMVMMRETLKQLKTIQLAVIIIVMHQEELNLSLGFLKNR